MASPSEVATEEQRPISAAGKTDVGRRRDHNEDQILVSHELGLYAVADGMGGHQAGDVASSIAAAALEEFFWEEQELGGEPIEGLEGLSEGAARLVKAVHHCNREVFARSGRSANQGGMGSTLVALFVEEAKGVVHIAHVGDSRCYRIRHGRIEQLTKDHSMINEALRLNPDLSEEILKQLPSNVVTRALGTKENVQPDVCTEPLCRDDLYLLCSDGLSGEVADEDLLFGVLESEELKDGCELLVAMANEAGGRDNISAVLVRVDKGATPPPPGAEPRLVEEAGAVDVDLPDEDDELDAEIDAQLDDADLDDWLAAEEADGEAEELDEDVVFSDIPPPPEEAAGEDDPEDYDDADVDEGDVDEAYDDDVPEPHDEAYVDDDAELEVQAEVALDEDELDEDELAEDELAQDELAEDDEELDDHRDVASEGLAALAPPFGNEPPRLRRKSSFPPDDLPPDEEISEIAAVPVMGIGDMEPLPESAPARRCNQCGHKLLPEERFCGMCGARTMELGETDPSVPSCDACGAEVLEDTRFCVECGVRL